MDIIEIARLTQEQEMKKGLLIFLALSSLNFLSCTSTTEPRTEGNATQTGNAIIAGKYVDKNGDPVEGAKIIILNSNFFAFCNGKFFRMF